MPRYPREHTPKLNRYSRTFARLLFQRFPEWKALAGTYSVGEPGLMETLLKVRVPPPNPQVEAPLVIRTVAAPQEILISWMDGWHLHVSHWPGREEDVRHLHRALESLDRLITEQDLVYNVYRLDRDGRSSAGGTAVTGVEHPSWSRLASGERLVIRSWLGTYDREIIAP